MRDIKIPKLDRSRVPGQIIYEVIVGDQLYGIRKDSPTKIKGIYVADKKSFYTREYPPIFTTASGVDYYEYGTFLDLLRKGDITAVEMIFAPESYHVTCSELIKTHLMGKKVAFLTSSFPKNVLSYIKKSMESVKMTMDTFKKIYSDVKKTIKIDPKDHIYMMTPSTNISNSKTFKEYLESKTTREARDPFNYLSLPSHLSKNVRFVYFSPSMDGVYGLVNDLTGELVEYEKDVSFRNYHKKHLPSGIISYNKERFIDESKEYIHKFEIVKEFEKETESNWNLDIYEKGDIFYDSERIMNCIRLLDMLVHFFDTYYLVRVVPENPDLLESILEGDIPFKTLYFDIQQKLALIDKKMSSYAHTQTPRLILELTEYPLRQRIYDRNDAVEKYMLTQGALCDSDIEAEEADDQWTD